MQRSSKDSSLGGTCSACQAQQCVHSLLPVDMKEELTSITYDCIALLPHADAPLPLHNHPRDRYPIQCITSYRFAMFRLQLYECLKATEKPITFLLLSLHCVCRFICRRQEA